jgi:hypothetical protein
VKSPQTASSRRGLETENGKIAEGRGEDALQKKNYSSTGLIVSVINAYRCGIMLKFVSIELIINRLQQLYKTPLCS